MITKIMYLWVSSDYARADEYKNRFERIAIKDKASIGNVTIFCVQDTKTDELYAADLPYQVALKCAGLTVWNPLYMSYRILFRVVEAVGILAQGIFQIRQSYDAKEHVWKVTASALSKVGDVFVTLWSALGIEIAALRGAIESPLFWDARRAYIARNTIGYIQQRSEYEPAPCFSAFGNFIKDKLANEGESRWEKIILRQADALYGSVEFQAETPQ